MSNNPEIAIYDFENICRTCLSRQDLKLLYEKCFPSIHLVDMLMTCTFVKFTEDDGLPVKICTSCISEINQAFSFAKRCEATDTILRNCKMKAELKNISSQTVESIIKSEHEIQLEIKPEIVGNYEYVEIAQGGGVKIENEYDPVDESYEEDVDPHHVETYSEKSNYPGSKLRTDSQIEEENSENEDDFPPGAIPDLLKIHRIHEENEKGEKPHVCSICTKAFTQDRSLNLHMKKHKEQKSYPCRVCSKIFTQSSSFRYHMRLHTGEKPYTCEVCNKGFSHSSNLIYHKRTHSEAKYKCELCNKTFIQPNRLKYHMTIHSGDKPYSCVICSKGFTLANYLKKHMRIHTGEKPYSCEVCDKSFVTNGDLRSHKKTHTGEKPHICSVCSRAFAQIMNLKTHMRIHTGEKPFSCDVCEKSFITKQRLADHKDTHRKNINVLQCNKY